MYSFLKTSWLAFAPGVPQFVRDYNRFALLQRLHKRGGAAAAIASVGGDYEGMGLQERDLLLRHGLREDMVLVDVGCGAGRLAYALRPMPIAYTGTDVVPALLAFARQKCQRPDWRFECVRELVIPVPASSADMVTFFSVFTHLRHLDTYAYLEEARRTLKPGGRIVFSFLDFAVPLHWRLFEQKLRESRIQAVLHPVIDEFVAKEMLPVWASHLGLELVAIEDAAIGQSVCVMRKPAGAASASLE